MIDTDVLVSDIGMPVEWATAVASLAGQNGDG
jgi:hypothetical protein